MSILKVGRPSKKDSLMNNVQNKEEPTIRMNINIPKSLHKKLKLIAIEKDTTVTNIVIKELKNISL